MTMGKPKSPEITFSEGNIFVEARNIPLPIINENIFAFDLAGRKPEETSFS